MPGPHAAAESLALPSPARLAFRGSTEEELLAWLRQVLLNNLSNFARRYRGTAKRDVRREVRLELGVSSLNWRDELSGAAATPSQHAEVRETNESLEEALARLPTDYQRVILLRYRNDLAFEEIARMMHRSSNAVRKLWARAVEQLQREMER